MFIQLEKEPYLLDLQTSDLGIATVASDETVRVHDWNLNLLRTFEVGAQLSQVETRDHKTFWASCSSKIGGVAQWDLRTEGPITVIKTYCPIHSFSINAIGSIVATGSELDGEDATISLWDIRNPAEPIAKFTESHSEDITQLKFHPSLPNLLASGSTDGLISMFDIQSLEEEDALIQTFKHDSIAKIEFFGPEYQLLYDITHTEALGLWNLNSGEEIVSFSEPRNQSRFPMDYLVDCIFHAASNQLCLLGGNLMGELALWNINPSGLEYLQPVKTEHQDIVRCASWNAKRGLLLTGGEDGRICATSL